jgi:hypothetical protein
MTTRAHAGSCLRAIANHARGLDSMEIKLTPREARDWHLLRHGYLRRDEKPINVMLPPGDPEASVYFDRDAWTFTWSDSDVDRAL